MKVLKTALKTPKGFMGALLMVVGLILTFILPRFITSTNVATTVGIFTGLTSVLGGHELTQAIAVANFESENENE